MNEREGSTNLIRAAGDLIQVSKEQEQELKAQRGAIALSRPLAEMTRAELKAFFSEPRGLISKKDRRGLEEIRRLTQAFLTGNEPERNRDYLHSLIEIAAALTNNRRPPAPAVIDFLQPPLLWLDYRHNPVARGTTPATNLKGGDIADLSRADPESSTFWSRVDSIASQDLYAGFGRSELPRFDERTWQYDGPKTSYGTGPGFEATSGSLKVKVKFLETMSEPFTARIFAALGYNVEPTDYVPGLKLKYDRRFFKEFHLRKDIQTKIRAACVVPVYTIRLQKRYDPFAFIDAAVMQDGARVTGAELKTLLFHRPERNVPEDEPGNFREDVERRIAYLVTAPANVQLEDRSAHSIGPWDFGQLGHQERRELRALGLLAAWVGWFDSRFENTRLKIVKNGERAELKHFITDLGGGLGRSVGPLSRRCESPNEFAWSCTRAPKYQGKGRMIIPFRVVNYEPNEDTRAFQEMTFDDARWMARLIGALTESQIVQALVASGFDSAQVKLFAEKLISRRDQMVCDLGLGSELALLRPDGTDRALSYRPAIEGRMKITTRAGVVTARTADLAVENGRVVATAKGPSPAGPADVAQRR